MSSLLPNQPPSPRTAEANQELQRLHLIHALFAQATGHDLYLAAQIKAAIVCSLADYTERLAREQAAASVSQVAMDGAVAAGGGAQPVAAAGAALVPDGQPPGDDAVFLAAAVELLGRFFAGLPGHGFFHWDALVTSTAATPLFARAELMVGLKSLARFPAATLLVTNLRPALLPPGRDPGGRRQRDYEETLAYLRELAAARRPAGSELHLWFM